MRILQVLDYLPSFAGGMVDHLVALGHGLHRKNHHLTLAFPRNREWLTKLRGVAQVVILPQITHPLRDRCVPQLRRLCREQDVDLIHLHFSFALPFALACDVSRWQPAVIYHWHSPPKVLGPESRQRKGLGLSAERLVSRAAARFADWRVIHRHVAISHEIHELLVGYGWTRAAKVHLVPNAVPRIPESPCEPRPGRLADPVIGSVANFRLGKDHVTLLEAFAQLSNRWPRARLLLVGDGPTRPTVESLARNLGIEAQVRFLGTLADVDAVLQRLDAFVLSTRYEGHPLALLEAMSHGLPVVASAASSIPETVRHEGNGLLFAPGEAKSLAHQLERLIEDPSLRARLGGAARSTVCEHYPLSLWVNRMIALYEEAIAEA